MSKKDFSINDLIKWKNNPTFNPLTKRKIKENGPIYKKIRKLYSKYEDDINKKKLMSSEIESYVYYRRNIIDPILLENLPLYGKSEKDLFCYSKKWNPFTGESIEEEDENGPLYFDPNALIHYFYTNRLNNLWSDGYIYNNEYINGYYLDAVGNAPDFEVKGRGKHPEWYLFRLPIIDCYIPKNYGLKEVTMGPKLNEKEIKKIYSLSKRYGKKFKEEYNYKRPNLIKMKKIYDSAINNNSEFDNLINENYTLEEINYMKYQLNISAVNKLKNFK